MIMMKYTILKRVNILLNFCPNLCWYPEMLSAIIGSYLNKSCLFSCIASKTEMCHSINIHQPSADNVSPFPLAFCFSPNPHKLIAAVQLFHQYSKSASSDSIEKNNCASCLLHIFSSTSTSTYVVMLKD
jgi:hypothetical protein